MAFEAPRQQTTFPWDSREFNLQTRNNILSRVYFFKHRGVEVLYIDLSNGEIAMSKAVASECLHQVRTREPNSVRTLVNVEKANFDKELSAIGQHLAEKNKPYVRKSAVIGISGLRSIVLDSITSFAKREIKSFKTKAEALEWLVVD